MIHDLIFVIVFKPFSFKIEVEPGDGVDGSDLYLPEKWKTGNRLDWAAEDRRKKLFVGVEVNKLF